MCAWISDEPYNKRTMQILYIYSDKKKQNIVFIWFGTNNEVEYIKIKMQIRYNMIRLLYIREKN